MSSYVSFGYSAFFFWKDEIIIFFKKESHEKVGFFFLESHEVVRL